MSGADRLLETLTHKLRLLTQDQAEAFVSASTLRRLEQSGMLVSVPTLIYDPLPPVTEPLELWKLGDPPTDDQAVSYAAQKRLRGRGTRVVRLWVGTPRAVKLFGGVGHGRVILPHQASHDAGVAAVYMTMPEDIQRSWIGEDLLHQLAWPKSGKLPDAVVPDLRLAIEYASNYTPSRVRRFTKYTRTQGLNYAIY